MKRYTIEYGDRELLPDELDRKAADLGLTPEQLIRRFITEGMRTDSTGPEIVATSLDDFFVKTGVLKPKQ